MESKNASAAGPQDPDQTVAGKDPQDVAQFVHSLLQQVQDRFQTMSDQILTRIDDMGNRIDDLERNLNDLMTNAGIPADAATGQSGHTQTNNACDSTQSAQ